MRTIKLPFGEEVVALGQGTWHMAEDPSRREEEITALRRGLELGMTLIDTAEMYGGGRVEQLVGEAITGLRNEIFLVSKVLPHHATTEGTITACEDSLRRLGTDWLDLYLLHWRGPTPLEETLAAFEKLTNRGDIRSWGVSNFDLPDLEELTALPSGSAVQTDQVLYNLTRRGIEFDVLPWCRERGLPIMAYSPIEQGRLIGHPALDTVAARHRATSAQVALAWVLRDNDVIAIPKAGTSEHVRQNQAALDIHLTEEDLEVLAEAFTPPRGPIPLEML
jgi:diketogulonate reductase-like aldo/keto reductase